MREPPGGQDVLSDQNDNMKGRPSDPGAEDMIEQQPQSSTKARGPDAAALDEARLRQQAIGVRLRQMFDEVVNEPVPDEFLDILRRADKSAETE